MYPTSVEILGQNSYDFPGNFEFRADITKSPSPEFLAEKCADIRTFS